MPPPLPRVIANTKVTTDRFDILLGAVGFETRATYVAKTFRPRYTTGLALAFTERKVLNYAANLDWYRSEGFDVHEYRNGQSTHEILFSAARKAAIDTSDGAKLNFLVDVSSMSRPMIASAVSGLAELASTLRVTATFIYCPSKYVDLGEEICSMSYIGPVSSSFSGWTNDTRPPIVALAGLGGERGLALGAVEYLEATDVWAFLPHGIDARYDTAVLAANAELLERIGPSRVIRYDPLDGFGCFCSLETLAYGSLNSDRPILLPFGPKIFSVASLLVAQIYRPAIPVWRVSSEQSGEPVDREATGEVATISVIF